MMTFNNSNGLPTDLRHPKALVTFAASTAGAKPFLSADFGAWRLSDLIDPLENLISALPLPKSLFKSLPAKAGPCILVVDDDVFTFDLMEYAFDGDYEVLYAADGKAALDMAASRKPDLILLDVMMPHLDGYEVFNRLKADKRTSNIPVIFVTSLDEMSAEIKGLQLGAADYITKPINSKAVKVRVSNQIRLTQALNKLIEVAALEQALRDDLLEVLELKSRGQPVH